MGFADIMMGGGSIGQGVGALGGLIGGIGSLFKKTSTTPGEWGQRFASMPDAFWRTASPEQIAMQQAAMGQIRDRANLMGSADNPFASFRNAGASQYSSPVAAMKAKAAQYASMYGAKAGINKPAPTANFTNGPVGGIASLFGNPGKPADIPVNPPKFFDYQGMGSPTIAQQLNKYYGA